MVGIGEAMIRLSVDLGARLETATHYRVEVGGAEANVVAAVARMGLRSAWLTRLPTNPLGRRAAAEIGRHGVDVSHVSWTDEDRMGLYFVELGSPPRPTSVIYDRAGSAAGRMTVDDIPWQVVESATLVHLSGITPALSASCRTVSFESVKRARLAGTLVSVDVNYRAKLWAPEEAREVLTELCGAADLVLCTAEDARDVFRVTADPEEAAPALAEVLRVERVVLTDGERRAYWFEGGVVRFSEPYLATVVDRVGAGDAFAAGVIIGLLEDDLSSGVRRGLAMAALKLGTRGDQLMAQPDEVEALMRGNARGVVR